MALFGINAYRENLTLDAEFPKLEELHLYNSRGSYRWSSLLVQLLNILGHNVERMSFNLRNLIHFDRSEIGDVCNALRVYCLGLLKFEQLSSIPVEEYAQLLQYHGAKVHTASLGGFSYYPAFLSEYSSESS